MVDVELELEQIGEKVRVPIRRRRWKREKKSRMGCTATRASQAVWVKHELQQGSVTEGTLEFDWLGTQVKGGGID